MVELSPLLGDVTPVSAAAKPTNSVVSVVRSRVTALYFALLLVIFARLWVLPLRTGFWLDETQTVWIIQGGLAEVLSRCMTLKTQPPAYFIVAWLVSKLGGPSELLLRLPSIIAMAIATYLLYRLAVRLVGRQAAWPSIIVFASSEAVAFAAADARPYAIAMLAVIGAILLLVRWLDTGRQLDGIGYCVLASVSVYMHYLFAATLLVHLIYAVYRVRTERRITFGQLSLVATLIGLLLLPSILYVLALLRTPRSYSFIGIPQVAHLFLMLAPPVLLGSALGALLLFRLVWRDFGFRLPNVSGSTLVLLVSWTLVPCVLLFSMSMLTNLKVFLPRYLLPYQAGLALLAGWALGGIEPLRSRLLAVTAVVLASLLCAADAQFPHGGDWRAAMAAVRSVAGKRDMPVLMRSGFVESEPFDWLGDERRSSYLFAPLSVYPAAGNVLRLPSQLSPSSIAYLNELMTPLEHSERFLFVNMGDTSYESWLLGRLSSAGFEKHRVGRFGGSLTVDLFFRSTRKSQSSGLAR